VNGKFYIGVHKTSDPNDEYLGSGRYIKASIAKYGPDKFKKTVLLTSVDESVAFSEEKRLIAEARATNKSLCMNIHEGGNGGFSYINRNNLCDRRELTTVATRARLNLLKDPTWSKKLSTSLSEGAKRSYRTGRRVPRTNLSLEYIRRAQAKWTGSKHSLESRRQMSSKKLGPLNNQYGTRWITDGTLNKKVWPSVELPEGWYYGRVVLRRR